MKISEAIKILQEFEKKVGGDVPIVSVTDVDERFCIEFERTFDLIELPDENESMDNSQLVCAFMEPSNPDRVEYPDLRVIK